MKTGFSRPAAGRVYRKQCWDAGQRHLGGEGVV